MTTVIITDEAHELFGKELSGHLCYYDINHTGSSPDLFQVKWQGNIVRLLSTQVNVKHYEGQNLVKEMARLGANVGDVVEIVEIGSGSFSSGWIKSGKHVISKITECGHVEFDHGKAFCFRPVVRIVSA
ncbi:hypothetical protein [Photobacterium carnosum]|uniref:hypothetical protein n=1 Tax=Photobacterium carnosum TaxID=2023717 RepID=UPI001E60AFE5|nr:hypothetical protein [Photobacterium carnosum]MCD9517098.1 hypothetical protein [Photobacterium carnosum]